MRKPKLDSVLEKVTSVLVLLAALGVSTFFLVNYYQRQSVARVELGSGMRTGETLPVIEGVSYHQANRTLLIVMNTDSQHCIDSVAFYNRLLDAQRRVESPVSIFALFPNPEQDVKRFINESKLQSFTVSGADVAKLKLTATPALVLVDREGRVEDFWSGKLTPETEQEVLDRIAGR